MGVLADPGSFRWCQALSRSRSFATKSTSNQHLPTIKSSFAGKQIKQNYRSNYYVALLIIIAILTKQTIANNINPEDAVHITAILGESVVFNCHVEFPNDHPVPYVLQWDKKVSETGSDVPIYIWYENYPTHSGEGYEGRVSRVSPDSPYGAASLNLTNIQEADQGWYECKVVFLNRDPKQHKNGTWFHLDVHAPPRFSVTPEEIIYVNLGDSIILNCQADGTPTPEILWYKDADPVEPSSTVGIFNDGTELRISTIRNEDIGEYTCVARNGEGQVSHTARVIIAGGAVIMVPPTNQTKLEGEKVIFPCEAKAMPGNVTVRWFREGSPVREVASLETRITIRKDGSLIINPVSADDSGQYLCEVTNGIGDPQTASAYLNVEYPAKVTFTPTVQYLPFRLAGVVQCYIKANPPLQYVTWTKDKRLLEPYQTEDIVVMNNGSLLFTRVNQSHQGRYTCTPYNAQGTQGSSGPMEILVRKPPTFTIEPEPLYQRKVGESVEMHCDALEAEGTQKINIQWQRRDGAPLQRNRVKMNGGNITVENLRRSDFGYYQCVASNEVATIVSATQLVIEGTQPHAPYNLSATATDSSVTIQWMPGYSGGPDYKQDYTIWYREAGVSDWSTIPVTPSGSTQVTINRLSPGTTYEFQVVGKNALGEGMMSKVMTIKTLDAARTVKAPTPVPNEFEFSLMPDEAGPKPGQPRNVTVTEVPNGFLITWQSPLERAHLVKFYTIKYRTDAQWKTLNRGQIRPEETNYLVKNLVGGRKRNNSFAEYNMVACRITDARNTASRTGSASSSQVPLKKFKQGRISGLRKILTAILHWIWPPDRCKNCQSVYSVSVIDQVDGNLNNVGQIHRTIDGRFVVGNSPTPAEEVDEVDDYERDRRGSQSSSSDDGGFLARRAAHGRASWRRPLVASSSQLSLRSESSAQNLMRGLGGLLKIGTRPQQHLYKNLPLPQSQPLTQNLHINTVSGSMPGPVTPSFYTPSKVSRIFSSSPASTVGVTSPWSANQFSDLSTVYPSSAERSFPTPSSGNLSRFRLSQELPSLRTIQEETRQLNHGFVPLHIHSPSWRGYYQTQVPYHSYRPRTRWFPRHSRITRSNSELLSPLSPLNFTMRGVEASPESRSSSSGFGSKNTSSQQQGSHSGSTSEWRLLPPYRPPPPPPSTAFHQQQLYPYYYTSQRPSSPPYTMEHWLEMISRLNNTTETPNPQKGLDVGSVDCHYEFDPSTPTPSASTPTGAPRDDLHVDPQPTTSQFHTIGPTTGTGSRKSRPSRYDNIEARVQAMKEEFYAYRKRQAMRRAGVELESAC
ncbi:unnamed protein product [Hermetia illucens]|uniref:Protein turtle n=1 Tax=Hermetia illucens TaxID=343691 RepID=A0A7R8YR92_HERIL|nr:unnamed protein product [Hermetia illucens]